MSPTTYFAVTTSTNLKGCKWNKEIINPVMNNLIDELDVSADIPEGMHEYRETLACSLFIKFYLYVSQALWIEIPDNEKSGIDGVTLPLTQSTQCYEHVPNDQPSTDPVGRPIHKESANAQVTGTARFLDDLPRLEGELCAAEVISQKVHAKIVDVDVKETLALEGVIDYISYLDVPYAEGGSNKTGVRNEEEIFAESEVSIHPDSFFLHLHLLNISPIKTFIISHDFYKRIRSTVYIGYSDNAGGIYFWAKLSLYPIYHYIQ